MSTTYAKKVEVVYSNENERILDGQSKICNWLYNYLLNECNIDYKYNNNERHLLSGRNLRDFSVTLKEENPFLKSVFSSVLKECSRRLKLAFESFFDGRSGYPNYRSWSKKWFSLVYDDPNAGWEIRNDGQESALALGKIPNMPKEKGYANPYVKGKLKEKVILAPNEIFKTCSLVKQHGKFYVIFVIEKCSTEELDFKAQMTQYRKDCNKIKKADKVNNTKTELPEKPVLEIKVEEPPADCKWAAIDPNHKNFFVLLDYQGNNILFKKLDMIKYWDKTIDKLKSKRDKCKKNYRKRKSERGNAYTVHSPRWNYLNDALERAYDARREQIKSALYSIAHTLYDRYDLIMIGDYTPSNETAPYQPMKRSMLNQEEIGNFRRTLEWVAKKEDKFYLKIDETNTTKECCICGNMEKKAPSVREYTCPVCGTTFQRDINSSANIGKKGGYSLDKETLKKSISQFTHKGSIQYSQKTQIVAL